MYASCYRQTSLTSLATSPSLHPLIIDDYTLAFFLNIRNKTLWHLLYNKEKVYNVFPILKRDGSSNRIIHEPNDLMMRTLQKVHTRLLLPLQEKLGEHVTAYRPTKSVTDGVKQHIPNCNICDSTPKGETAKKHECPRYGTYIHMDLENFFHNNSRAYLRYYFTSLGYNFQVSSLISDLLTVGLPTTQYPTPCAGVPQGSPASGAICNLVADQRIDHTILQYLDTLNTRHNLKGDWCWVYSRYADDLTLTCGKDFPFETKKEIVKDLTKIINEGGYRVNFKKTRITSGYRRRTLGVNFHQKINIPRQKYLALRALVHNCVRYGFHTQYRKAKKNSTQELIEYLRGMINYVTQVHPTRGKQLQTKFNTALAVYGGN